MVNKIRALFFLVIFLFFSNFVLGQTEYVIEQGVGVVPPNQADDTLMQMQQITAQYAALSQKIDESQAVQATNLTELAKFVYEKNGELYSSIIITVIIINLATIGIIYAVFFSLKARRLI